MNAIIFVLPFMIFNIKYVGPNNNRLKAFNKWIRVVQFCRNCATKKKTKCYNKFCLCAVFCIFPTCLYVDISKVIANLLENFGKTLKHIQCKHLITKCLFKFWSNYHDSELVLMQWKLRSDEATHFRLHRIGPIYFKW